MTESRRVAIGLSSPVNVRFSLRNITFTPFPVISRTSRGTVKNLV